MWPMMAILTGLAWGAFQVTNSYLYIYLMAAFIMISAWEMYFGGDIGED